METEQLEQTPQEIAEAQAAKDAELMAKLQEAIKTAVIRRPNRAERRHRHVNRVQRASSIAGARRRIRRRMEKASRRANR